ncbi:cadherin-related family member 3-like [Pelobates fuscus]|uniref:cadherin-related family member 3-like n=1 Tax=Pelobates fuscus TaxID=191477 RepID=UPI002FE4B1A6
MNKKAFLAFLFSILQGISAAPEVTMPRNVTLPENSPQNKLVAIIKATDPSDSIVGGPYIVNCNPVVHPFMIIPKGSDTWELITTSSPKLNFEKYPLYTLQIIVENSQGILSTNTLIIEITKVNKAPNFTGTLAAKDAEVYIAENTPLSTVIYKVSAKDPDNDILQYTITITPGNSGFKIDNTGTISTTTMFDYESSAKSYTITVTISDGVLSKSGDIKVGITNVNDNDPSLTCIFSSITSGSIITKTETSGNTVNIRLDEELPIGTVITTCSASDADAMNDLTFLLDPGSNYFSVHKDTGTVIIVSRMDSEATGFVSVQSFTIKVCDSGLKCAPIAATATVVPINDNPPFCDPFMYSVGIPEPIPKDTIAAVLKCHDADIPPDVLDYQPSSGPIGIDALFVQKAGNPHIIQVNKELDYDTDAVTSYEMMVTVSDSPKLTHTVTTTIIVSVTPVNDFNPVFDSATYTFTVHETSGVNYDIGGVSATDKDHPSCVRYGIVNGNRDVISRFWLNPITGRIKLITHPDFETRTSYNLTIEATDCDPVNPQKAQSTVIIIIIEENDEAPICKPSRYTAVIYDNVTSGLNINNFRLNCNDDDSSDASMRFEIVSGNINNHFAFDPTHGSHNPKLIVKNPFDFDNGADMQQKYNLLVNIIDDNVKNRTEDNPRTGTVLIYVTVVRTNTPAPPTTDYYQRKGLTIVYKEVNTFDSSAWYVPFIYTIMALLLAGLTAWALHLLWKYANLKALCQKARRRFPHKRVKTYLQGTKKEDVEVITETITYEAVFDGQTVDPVTGQMYEYNTKSGARRWKNVQGKEENINLSDISAISEAIIPQTPPAPLMPPIKEF